MRKRGFWRTLIEAVAFAVVVGVICEALHLGPLGWVVTYVIVAFVYSVWEVANDLDY